MCTKHEALNFLSPQGKVIEIEGRLTLKTIPVMVVPVFIAALNLSPFWCSIALRCTLSVWRRVGGRKRGARGGAVQMGLG